MPAESARLLRRIGRRDRWFVAIIAGGALAATPAAILLSDSGAPGSAGAGCVSAIVPGFMGGETHVYCGAEARAFCRSEVARGGETATACREEVLAADSARP